MGWIGELPPEEKARQARMLENSLQALRGQQETMGGSDTVLVDPRAKKYEQKLKDLKGTWVE